MGQARKSQGKHGTALPSVVHSSVQLGEIACAIRKAQGLTQLDLAGIGGLGNRFVIDLEKGKPTIQLQKAMDVLALLGLELVVRKKGGA